MIAFIKIVLLISPIALLGNTVCFFASFLFYFIFFIFYFFYFFFFSTEMDPKKLETNERKYFGLFLFMIIYDNDNNNDNNHCLLLSHYSSLFILILFILLFLIFFKIKIQYFQIIGWKKCTQSMIIHNLIILNTILKSGDRYSLLFFSLFSYFQFSFSFFKIFCSHTSPN